MSQPKVFLDGAITIRISKEVTIVLKEEDVNTMWYLAKLADKALTQINPKDVVIRLEDRDSVYTNRLSELILAIRTACR